MLDNYKILSTVSIDDKKALSPPEENKFEVTPIVKNIMQASGINHTSSSLGTLTYRHIPAFMAHMAKQTYPSLWPDCSTFRVPKLASGPSSCPDLCSSVGVGPPTMQAYPPFTWPASSSPFRNLVELIPAK